MKSKKACTVLLVFVSVLLFLTCCGYKSRENKTNTPDAPQSTTEEAGNTLMMQIGAEEFEVILEENEAAIGLLQMAQQQPIQISLREYGGFEKVGPIGVTLPAEDEYQTAEPGDIMLYTADQLVLFYGSNTWSYTKIGHVEDINRWIQALQDEQIDIILTIKGEKEC